MKQLRLAAMTAVAVLAVTELIACGGLWALRGRLEEDIPRRAEIYREQTARIAALIAEDGVRREMLDPVLGWRYRPGYASATDTINLQGLRSTRTYSSLPRASVLRVAAFGDSFVYSNEVADEDAWAAIIERRFPHVEVLNYGVGGYGSDQAYLRYLAEGDDLAPHVVLMGFVSDDLRRVVSVYRRFVSVAESPLFKPRFVLSAANELELVPTPTPDAAAYARYLTEPAAIREAGARDQWYEPLIYENVFYDWSATVRLASTVWIRTRRRYIDEDRLIRNGQFSESASAFTIQLKLFERFAGDVRRSRAEPMIVFFPDQFSLAQALAGDSPVYQPLMAATRRSGIPTVDLAEPFVRAVARDGIAGLFMPGGHYSPSGNEVVARAIAAALADSGHRADQDRSARN